MKDINKIRLTKEERQIEAEAHLYVPVDAKTFKEMADAVKARRKDAVLSIRINSQILQGIKRQAEKHGVRYQIFIAEILRNVAAGKNLRKTRSSA